MGSNGGPARKSSGKAAKEPATYQFRDVVLAKVRGYPPWPGMVVDPEAVPPNVSKERPSKKSSFYCVRFFPAGDYSWLPAKELSKLQKHEIESFINEPHKKNGELSNGYKIALDPTDWEKNIEETIKNLKQAEEEAEVDQLQSEGADEDDDEDKEKKPKTGASKKRKRDSEPAATKKAAKSAKPKSDSAAPAGGAKKKGGAAAKSGKKGGSKSKNTVESEDDGEAEDEEDAGPSSKKVSPPPAKKSKKGKEEEEVDESLASDPEAVRVRTWRHQLQKVFLGKTAPKDEDVVAANHLFTDIEQYDKMTIQYLTFSKIGKVLRHIIALTDEKVPRDDDFKFRERSQKLVDKWHQSVNAMKTNGDAPAANGATTEEKPAAAETNGTTEEKAKANGEDAEMADAQAEDKKAAAAVDKKEEDEKKEDSNAATDANAGDVSVLADVTMSEAGAETA